MNFSRINDVNVFSYDLNTTNHTFFKILHIYPNRSRIFSSWFEIKTTNCSLQNVKQNSDYSYTILFTLAGVLVILLIVSILLWYFRKIN